MKRLLRNIIWAIIIFILCAIPGDTLPTTPLINIPYFDKLVHFGMFFILGIFTISELNFQTRLKKWEIAVITILVAALYGGAIELLQQNFFVYRSGDYADFIADVLGAVAAVIVFAPLKKQKDLLLNRKPFVYFPFLKKILF